MLISAAIIVKNEEKVMQRCLDCVSLFADEIVVLDTGSTDKTKQIAQQHPKVCLFDSDHFGAWTHFSEFSFSIAKNEAIDKCQGDYIVWWDADDFIDEENAAKIRRIAEQTKEVCLYTFTVKYGPLTFEHCRMFRNGHGIRFDEAHSVHEFLNTLGHPNHSRREVEMLHLPGEKGTPSSERNLAIMEKDYYERGMNDARTMFYMANGYREAGRHDEAVKFYRLYLEKSEWPEERFFARYYMAQAYVVLGNPDEARKEALRAMTEDFRFAEAYCLLGDLTFRDGDYERAQNWFMLAANTPFPQDAKLFVVEALYGSYPNGRIRECHEKLTGQPSPSASDASTKVEYVADVKEVMATFRLPPEVDEAIMAGGVLAAIAEASGKLFEVVVDRPEVEVLVDCAAGLSPADDPDEAFLLILPPNLNGRSREEWYGRAAGHVPDDWEPLIQAARKVSAEAREAISGN